MASPATAAKPALIFIPDISGFTRFVSQTEIAHAQHIVRELLECIIASNRLAMQVAEVEGDAVLFHRFGALPGARELLDQVRTTFIAFHAYLRQYDAQRICPCGACRGAHGLTLKFVVHCGELALQTLAGRSKPFGVAPIVAHRLLKNRIASSQYALFSDAVTAAAGGWDAAAGAAWAALEAGEDDYDSGTVHYQHLSLAPLLAQVPPPAALPAPVFGRPARRMDHFEVEYPHPAERVFEAMLDLPRRVGIVPGVSAIDWKTPHRVNRGRQIRRQFSGALVQLGEWLRRPASA